MNKIKNMLYVLLGLVILYVVGYLIFTATAI